MFGKEKKKPTLTKKEVKKGLENLEHLQDDFESEKILGGKKENHHDNDWWSAAPTSEPKKRKR